MLLLFLFSFASSHHLEGTKLYIEGMDEVSACDVIYQGIPRYEITAIEIDDTCVYIQPDTFVNCIGCETVKLPESLEEIGDYAFAGMESLTEITIPSQVQFLPLYAFAECYSLNSVTLNEGLYVIGQQAFYRCESLKSITIPSTVVELGLGVFFQSGVEEFIVAEGNPFYFARDGVLFYKNDTLLISVLVSFVHERKEYDFKDITEEDNLTEISHYSFSGCQLERITIPDSILLIGKEAFRDCENLIEIKFDETTNLQIIESGAFVNTMINEFYIGEYLEDIQNTAFDYCKNLTNFTVNENNKVYKSDEDGAAILDNESSLLIIGCKGLSKFKLQDGVIRILDRAFATATNLEHVELNSELQFIDAEAFSSTSIYEIILPDSLLEIGDYCFSETYLESITIPKNLETIGISPFIYCGYLVTINIDPENTRFKVIKNETFAQIDGDDKVILFAIPGVNFTWREFAIPNDPSITRVASSAYYGIDFNNSLIHLVDNVTFELESISSAEGGEEYVYCGYNAFPDDSIICEQGQIVHVRENYFPRTFGSGCELSNDLNEKCEIQQQEESSSSYLDPGKTIIISYFVLIGISLLSIGGFFLREKIKKD